MPDDEPIIGGVTIVSGFPEWGKPETIGFRLDPDQKIHLVSEQGGSRHEHVVPMSLVLTALEALTRQQKTLDPDRRSAPPSAA